MRHLFRLILILVAFSNLAARGLDTPRRPVVAAFTAGFGGGHDTANNGLIANLRARHPDAEIVILRAEDYTHFAQVMPWIARFSSLGFNAFYQHLPNLYEPFFESTMRSADKVKSAGDIFNPSFSKRRIMRDLERIQPDVIYSTWHVMTSKLIWLREHGELNPEIPLAWLDTDFVHEKFFYDHTRGADLTYIAHPKIQEERIAHGVPADKMKTTGLFVNPFVFEPFSEQDRLDFLKRAMSMPDQPGQRSIWINGVEQPLDAATINLTGQKMLVTIASGRAGVGDFETIIDGLATEADRRGIEIQIVAVCGENAGNFRRITKAYLARRGRGEYGHVTLVASRFVDNAKLMRLVRSSKIFIGKSGSLSPFEAAIMDVPRVLLSIIGGQERHAAEFYAREDLAEIVAPADQAELGRRAFTYIEDEELMAKRRVADQIIRDSYDPGAVADFLDHALATRNAKPPVRPVGYREKWTARQFLEDQCERRLGWRQRG